MGMFTCGEGEALVSARRWPNEGSLGGRGSTVVAVVPLRQHLTARTDIPRARLTGTASH